MSDSEWEVIEGDSRQELGKFADNTFDSVVTDPPYDLTSIQKRFGSEDSAPAQHGKDGSFARLSKGFMGKTWDGTGVAFTPAFWAEVYRVLKPGGFLIAAGGSRTFHRMVCAIEDSGFEIRDCITWHFGSGFPKNLDVSKAIDKQAGAKREVTSEWRTGRSGTLGGKAAYGGLSTEDVRRTSTPATDEPHQWQGWGTALKPATEFWTLARKPLSEGSVAQNVLRWGTGAINIDDSRIGNGSDRVDGGPSGSHDSAVGEWGLGYGAARPSGGRWPANLILAHSPDCRKVGTKKVRNPSGPASGPTAGHWGMNGIFGGANPPDDFKPAFHADEDGMETVEAWECVEGCPVRLLDEQSGVSTSSGGRSGHEGAYSGGFRQDFYGDAKPGLGDTGGASRFFATLSYDEEMDVPFFYCAKASSSERGRGLGKRSPTTVNDGSPTIIDNPYQRGETLRQNTHPTVKPVALMEWLIRLVTPKGGKVLDPFLGSGTTGVAAVKGGWDFVGIEGEHEYVEIANPRISHEAGKPRQLDLFSA